MKVNETQSQTEISLQYGWSWLKSLVFGVASLSLRKGSKGWWEWSSCWQAVSRQVASIPPAPLCSWVAWTWSGWSSSIPSRNSQWGFGQGCGWSWGGQECSAVPTSHGPPRGVAGGSILHEDLSPSCAERRLESLPENIDVEFSVHPGVLEKNNQLAQHAIAKNSPGHQLLGLLDSDSLIPRYPPIDLKRESVSAWLDDDNVSVKSNILREKLRKSFDTGELNLQLAFDKCPAEYFQYLQALFSTYCRECSPVSALLQRIPHETCRSDKMISQVYCKTLVSGCVLNPCFPTLNWQGSFQSLSFSKKDVTDRQTEWPRQPPGWDLFYEHVNFLARSDSCFIKVWCFSDMKTLIHFPKVNQPAPAFIFSQKGKFHLTGTDFWWHLLSVTFDQWAGVGRPSCAQWCYNQN